MTEIERIQPGFSLQGFLDICRYDIVPNLLEAIATGNEEIVKDWCSEAVSYVFVNFCCIAALHQVHYFIELPGTRGSSALRWSL